jgi:hypothetical protein
VLGWGNGYGFTKGDQCSGDGWTKGTGVFTGNIKSGGHVNGGGGVVAVI